MSDTGETLQGQSASLLDECHSLLSYLQSNMVGEQPKQTVTEGQRASVANPIDDSIGMIQEARKIVEETRVLLTSAVIEKLR